MRLRTCTRTLVIVLAILRPPVLTAQPASELRPGARIRLAAPGIVAGTLDGTVITRSADSLTVASPDTPALTVAMSRISQLEVSRGRSRSAGAQRGMIWGGAIGTGFALLAAASVKECQQCTSGGISTTDVASIVTSGVFWGAVVGAIIGRESWSPFALAPAPSAALRSGHPVVGVRLAF